MGTYSALPVVHDDVTTIVNRIASDNFPASIRVYDAIFSSFRLLADMPGAGPSCGFKDPDLADLRYWPSKKYRNFLVIYRKVSDGVEIVRVVHGAQDMGRVLRSNP